LGKLYLAATVGRVQERTSRRFLAGGVGVGNFGVGW